MLEEPAHLRRLAAQVRDEADRVRVHSARLGALREVAWRSEAAALFRERVAGRVEALARLAGLLAHAADLLDQQAQQVRLALDRLAAVGALAAQGQAALHEAVRELRGRDG